MNLKRRDALLSMLFGAGLVGLRSLATGVPAAILMNPRKALAADADAGAMPGTVTNPQFFGTLPCPSDRRLRAVHFQAQPILAAR